MRGDQLARQWQLIQRLAKSRSGAALDDLAEELGCVRRTVYRDLDALMFAGFPVVSERREGRVYYRFLDSFRLGDVPFTPDEILALAFSEDLLRTLEGTVFHDSICSALRKIRAGLGPELAKYLAQLSDSFRVLPGPHKSYAQYRDTIQTLNDAVLNRRTLQMRYRTARTGSVATRDLDPYRVWYRSGGLYVVGLSSALRPSVHARSVAPQGGPFRGDLRAVRGGVPRAGRAGHRSGPHHRLRGGFRGEASACCDLRDDGLCRGRLGRSR